MELPKTSFFTSTESPFNDTTETDRRWCSLRCSHRLSSRATIGFAGCRLFTSTGSGNGQSRRVTGRAFLTHQAARTAHKEAQICMSKNMKIEFPRRIFGSVPVFFSARESVGPGFLPFAAQGFAPVAPTQASAARLAAYRPTATWPRRGRPSTPGPSTSPQRPARGLWARQLWRPRPFVRSHATRRRATRNWFARPFRTQSWTP